jgi:hypothetical protein
LALNAREVKNTGGKKYPPFAAGGYPARLVQIIDLGIQPQEFKGEKKAPKRELMTTYEFLDEFLPDEDGNPDETKPRWLSEQFPLNNLDSELAKSTNRYYALDPEEEEDGNWLALIERPAMVTVIVEMGKDKVERNKIATVSAMRPKDAQKAPKLVNPPKVLDLDEPDVEIFLSLPQWVQDKIKNGLEFDGSPLDKLLEAQGGKGSSKKTKPASEPREGSIEADGIPEEW